MHSTLTGADIELAHLALGGREKPVMIHLLPLRALNPVKPRDKHAGTCH